MVLYLYRLQFPESLRQTLTLSFLARLVFLLGATAPDRLQAGPYPILAMVVTAQLVV